MDHTLCHRIKKLCKHKVCRAKVITFFRDYKINLVNSFNYARRALTASPYSSVETLFSSIVIFDLYELITNLS